MEAIRVEHLSKTFETKQKSAGFAGSLKALWHPTYEQREAVRDISFTVNAGERLAFIGPNGAGKSTTIKMLVGILYPTHGFAHVLGVVPWNERERLAYRIGSVFGQKSQLWFHLPPIDTFNLLSKIYELRPGDFKSRLASLVKVFEIGPLLQTPVRRLSLGERMRCELVASLLHRPQALFLDEPTIGLDVVVKHQIRDLLAQMSDEEGMTLVLTSHDAGDVEILCRRAIVINHGGIVYDGRVSELRREYIKSKQIDLKLREEFDGLDLAGVRVVKSQGYGVRLDVDTSQVTIETVIQRVMACYGIVDMEVNNPPMEAIIRQIYQDTGGAIPRPLAVEDPHSIINGQPKR